MAWIPVYYILCTDLPDRLVSILESEAHRNAALGCLIEIVSLPDEDNSMDFKKKQAFILRSTTKELSKILPVITNRQEIAKFVSGIKRNQRQIFENLAREMVIFYSEFYKNQYDWLIVFGQ